ncbi:MAG: hypothetical protein QXY32_05655, partial [Nitrososphaerota archaeon]
PATLLMTVAGYTLLSELERRPEIYTYLDNLGEKLRKNIGEILEKLGLGYTTGIGSLVGVHFTPVRPRDVKTAQTMKDKEKSRKYFRHLLENRIIALTYENPQFFISSAHTIEDIEKLIQATEEFAKNIVKR